MGQPHEHGRRQHGDAAGPGGRGRAGSPLPGGRGRAGSPLPGGRSRAGSPLPDARRQRRRLALALAITVGILLAEVIGAAVTGSLALLTDAVHMVTDVAALTMALLATVLAERPATDAKTFGLKRVEALSAAAQALLLLAVGGFVLVEAVRRLAEPPEVAATGMLVFGALGLAGNTAAILLLARSRHATLNLRAAFLEVLGDALGSLAVLVAAAVVAVTGYRRADPIASLVIMALIVPRAVALLRDVLHLLMEGTPRDLDLAEVRRHILGVEHVRAVHDLHVFAVATDLPVVTAHVVVDDSCFVDGHAPQLLDQLQACLAEHFPISVAHSTFQLEPAGHAGHEIGAHP